MGGVGRYSSVGEDEKSTSAGLFDPHTTPLEGGVLGRQCCSPVGLVNPPSTPLEEEGGKGGVTAILVRSAVTPSRGGRGGVHSHSCGWGRRLQGGGQDWTPMGEEVWSARGLHNIELSEVYSWPTSNRPY